MIDKDNSDTPITLQTRRFTDTRWTMVLRAQKGSEKALNLLCGLYWYPLYAYVRRRGYSREEAEDLTQGFFLRLISSEGISRARRERGKLRTFFLKDLEFYVRDEWVKGQTLKRGSGQQILSLDTVTIEERHRLDLTINDPHELHYDREWALALLEATFTTLRASFEKRGLGERFEVLKPLLTQTEADASYAQIGQQLGMTETAVKGAVFRLRQRFREVLIEQVADTVESEDDIREELNYLIRLFQSELSV